MASLDLRISLKLISKVNAPFVIASAAIAQLGERQTEDLKAPRSIRGGGISFSSERDPNLFQYLIKQEAHPVRIAFRWLIRAFAGFLPAAEVIYLWDFILAYDSLGMRVRFSAKSNENRHFTPVRRWRLHSTPRLLARRADGKCD